MPENQQQDRAKWRQALVPKWTTLLREREEQVFLILTLLIGALVGLTAVAFILLTERFGSRLYPAGGTAWHRLLIPVVGSLLMGYLLYRYFPDARGSGIPQTKAALYAREGRITFATMFGKFFCTSATLASGIPLGREGPTVQVGAGIASVLGRNLGLRPEKVKALIPVASAAAIAAAFNTPLAAVLFALEEIVGDLHAPVLGSVVLASATSWAVLRLILGNNPLFQVPQYQLVNPWEFAIYAVLGVAGGLVSVAFTKLLLALRARFLKFPRRTLPFQPIVGGIAVGIMGWFVPQVLGVG
jgi:chloride channel protein, CIC family